MSRLRQLKAALTEWRRAELECVHAVFTSRPPDDIHLLKCVELYHLAEVRKIVDSQPWADIEQGL